MNTISIEGTKRESFGKAATRQVRTQDLVPGVIYGGEETVHFTTATKSLKNLVYTPEFQIAEVSVEGKTYRCIMKDLQFDPVTDSLTHIDFLELVAGKKVVANLPLKFNGQPVGVKAGGRLELKMKSLKVRTLPKNLVAAINVDISGLELNGNMRVEDVKADDMEVMNAMRQPIASVVLTRALRQAESEAAKSGAKK